TYPISGTVTNIGGGSVTNLSFSDTFNNNPQNFDSCSFSCSCGSNCTITGTNCSTVQLNASGTVHYTAKLTTTFNGGSDLVTATMGGTGGGSATAQSDTAQCLAIHCSNSVTITKVCDPGASLEAKNGLVAVVVDVSGTVTNPSDTVALSNITVHNC